MTTLSVPTSARPQMRPGLPAVLVLPALAAALLTLLPVAYLGVRATSGQGLGEALGMLIRPTTIALAARSVALAGIVAGSSVVLAGLLAWVTSARDLPWRRFWTIAASAPLAVPCFVGAAAFIAALSPDGPVGRAGALLGVRASPDLIYGFWGAALVLTLFTYPYAYLPLRVAMRQMDRSLVEAARSLGRAPARAFISVVIPQLLPAALAGGLLIALYVLREFGAVALLRCDTFTRAIYIQYQSSFDRVGAAVSCLALVGLVVLVLAASETIPLRRSGQGAGARRPIVVSLGRYRWAGAAACALVASCSVGIAIFALATWLLQAISAGEPFAPLWRAAATTGAVSAAAGALTLLAAVPVALLAARHRSWAAVVLERATHLGFALPGIVVALGFAFFTIRQAAPLYQSWAVVVLAYLVLFLAQPVGAVLASLRRIPAKLEEAARGLGRSPAAAFATVTLPLARPGMAAGALLVFLSAAKELPATLLLSPTGTETLATGLWHATSDGNFSRAAAPALMLVAISGVAVALMVRGKGVSA